jgi:hypothetical protein
MAYVWCRWRVLASRSRFRRIRAACHQARLRCPLVVVPLRPHYAVHVLLCAICGKLLAERMASWPVSTSLPAHLMDGRGTVAFEWLADTMGLFVHSAIRPGDLPRGCKARDSDGEA